MLDLYFCNEEEPEDIALKLRVSQEMVYACLEKDRRRQELECGNILSEAKCAMKRNFQYYRAAVKGILRKLWVMVDSARRAGVSRSDKRIKIEKKEKKILLITQFRFALCFETRKFSHECYESFR